MPEPEQTAAATQRTILVAPAPNEITAALQAAGFKTITWPALSLQPPENLAGLDEAIENLFGYDWLVFINADAFRFFLERFEHEGHEVSGLDSLRVCAIGEATVAALEHAQVHVDVIATQMAAAAVVDEIANYLGGRYSLQRLNFLLPQAAIGRDYLKNDLEDAGARADVIAAYQTVSAADMTRLIALQSILLTGSVDAVVFANDSDVSLLARLFDTNDLGRLTNNVVAIAFDEVTLELARNFGIAQPIQPADTSADAVNEALQKHFGL